VVDIHVDDVGEFIISAFPYGFGNYIPGDDLVREGLLISDSGRFSWFSATRKPIPVFSET